jgi:hypothetical protein
MMTDIDLIPSDYRVRRWFERSAKRLVIAITAVVIVTGATYAGVQHATKRVNAEIEILQGQQEISTRQRAELSQISEKKTRYEGQLKLLKGLRSGAAAQSMFVTIDRSLTGNDVWFVNWEFRRAGTVVEHEPETKNTGYFIVLPSGEGGKNDEAWKIETHMSIKGQARDYSALSRFVSRLLSQPEIQDVHVLSSSQRKYKDNRVIEFDLAVIVNTGVSNS